MSMPMLSIYGINVENLGFQCVEEQRIATAVV